MSFDLESVRTACSFLAGICILPLNGLLQEADGGLGAILQGALGFERRDEGGG